MIHFDSTLKRWQFNLPNHNVIKRCQNRLIYNQLFVDNILYLLNTDTGELYNNQIDLDKVDLLKLYNFNIGYGRFQTGKNGQMVRIHELIYGVKTNRNWVINHIDGNPSNNKLSNLELVTSWFNLAIQKKESGLPIGIKYHDNNYQTGIIMPRINGKSISFGSKNLNYLQNLHYQFGVKSKLVSSGRYLKEVPNWLPDFTIKFTPKHQIKLDQLITAHLENQNRWVNPSN